MFDPRTVVDLAPWTGAAAASRPPEGSGGERPLPPRGTPRLGGASRGGALLFAAAILAGCGTSPEAAAPDEAPAAPPLDPSAEGAGEGTRSGAGLEPAAADGAAGGAAAPTGAVAPAGGATGKDGAGSAGAAAQEPDLPTPLLDRGAAYVRVSGPVNATYTPTGLDCLPGVDLGLNIHATRSSPKVLPAWSAVLRPANAQAPATFVVTVGERRWGAVVDASALDATGGHLDGLRLGPMPRGTPGDPLVADVFYRCPDMATFNVPPPILGTLQRVTGAEPREWSGADYGRSHDARATSVRMRRADLAERVRTLRGQLPVGWVAFQGTLRDGTDDADEAFGEVVVGPGRGTDDIVRLGHTSPAHFGLDVEDVAAKMLEWSERYRINVVAADDDSVLARVARDADIPALAAEAGEFCPDIVREGPGTVEGLAKQIEASHQLFCWWE